MGNYVCCAPTGLLQCRHCQTTKVVLPTGELRQFGGPVYAAELMLDAPNHFLVSTRSMQVGRRFSPLPADEELEPGGVYAMFPMKRANLVATAADLASPLVAAATAAGRRFNGSVRIQPETVQTLPPTEACDSTGMLPESEAEAWPRLDGVRAHKLCTCRSRRPLLETINEEAISSA